MDPFSSPRFWAFLCTFILAVVGLLFAYRFHLMLPRAGAKWFVLSLIVGVALRAYLVLEYLVAIPDIVGYWVRTIGPPLLYGALALGMWRFLRGAQRVLRTINQPERPGEAGIPRL